MAKPFVNPFVSGQFLELRVDALVSDGRGLGRHDGVVVLVEDALPGQLVRAGRRRAEEPGGSRTC